MNGLKKNWQMLLAIFIDPWSLLLLGMATVSLVAAFMATETNAAVSGGNIVLILLPLALSSALLGTRMSKLWNSIIERQRLVRQGNSTIRNMKLVYANLTKIENCLNTYLTASNGQKIPAGFFRDTLDLSMMMLKEEIMHSIHPHPTVSEAVGEAVHGIALGQPIHL